MAHEKKAQGSKQKEEPKEKFFKDYQEEQGRKHLIGRIKNLSPWWFAGALFIALVVGQVAYFVAKFHFAKQEFRAELEKRKFIDYTAEVIVEDAPGNEKKTLYVTEEAVAYLDTDFKLYGYRFPTPTSYKAPGGEVLPISYSLKSGSVNGTSVTPEFMGGEGDGALALRDKSKPLKKGNNTFEVIYDIQGVPLQDKFGNESLTWHFPRPRMSLVEKVKAVVVLPQYASKDRVKMTTRIVAPGKPEGREAPKPLLSEVFLKGKSYIAVTGAATGLDPNESLELQVSW
ncbi:MAG: hypothetical protein KDD70_02010 [Bdellovibrionales bacterium]|nr:hypothetical protein [Bdellovibrionales bacterium]